MPPPEPIRLPRGSATASVFVFGGSERFSSSMRALVACNSLAAVTTTKTWVVGGGVSALSSRSAAISQTSRGASDWRKRLRRFARVWLRLVLQHEARLHEMRAVAARN